MEKRDFYIYNLEQANWMIGQNCKVIGCGMGKDKDVYILFKRDSFTEEKVQAWKLRQY